MKKNTNYCSKHCAGFTMVELAITLTIISIVTATYMMDYLTGHSNRAHAITLERMELIEQHLIKYYIVYGALPCPMPSQYGFDDDEFGIALDDPGSCSDSTGIEPQDDIDRSIMGNVPVRTLNLPDEYALDGWGRRINYVVDYSYTDPDIPHPDETLDTSTATPDYDEDGKPDVILADADGGNIIGYVPALLLSYGENGNWAVPGNGSPMYGQSGSKVTGSKITNNGNDDEKENAGTSDIVWVYRPFMPQYPDRTSILRFDQVVYPVKLDFSDVTR